MSSPDLGRNPAQVASDLTTAVNGLRQAVARSQLFIRLITVSLIFDVTLSIILGIVAYNANSASQAASNASSALVVNCRASNQARNTLKTTIDYLFSVPSQTPRTPAQQQEINQIKATVDARLAQTDCSKIGASNK